MESRFLKIMFIVCASLPLVSFADTSLDKPAEPHHIDSILYAYQHATLSGGLVADINSISVKNGEHITKGETLISFDCTQYKATLLKAEADESKTKVAYRAFKRQHELQLTSNMELAQATAAYKSAKAELIIQRDNVKKCILKAPYEGEVDTIYVQPYEKVQPNMPLISITDNSKLLLSLDVPSKWLSWLTKGAAFTINVPDTGQSYKTTVSRISTSVNSASGTISIYAEIENADGKLRNGMKVVAEFK